MIRFEYLTDEKLLYLAMGEGPVAETIEREESVYVYLDANGRPIRIEFLNADDFLSFLERRGGRLSLPEYIDDLAVLIPAS